MRDERRPAILRSLEFISPLMRAGKSCLSEFDTTCVMILHIMNVYIGVACRRMLGMRAELPDCVSRCIRQP